MHKIKLSNHPDIAKLWHPTKNGNETPDMVNPHTRDLKWWLCPLGHVWELSCHALMYNIKRSNGRTTGCPYCAGKKVCSDNCLATLFPEVAKLWHPTKNYPLTPYDVVAYSNKEYWWLCLKGHEYYSTCNTIIQNVNRAKGDVVGCPYCAGKKVCIDNCLATVCPEVAAEWHPTKNHPLTPFDIIANTHSKYWWLCINGHEYYSICKERILRGNGCPICKESKGEKKIAAYLTKNNYTFKRQVRFATCKHINILPFDFHVTTDKGEFFIEYNGEQHYVPTVFGTDKQKEKAEAHLRLVLSRDYKKILWCKDKNLLIIPYWEFNRIDNILDVYFSGEDVIFSEEPLRVREHKNLREEIYNDLLLQS